MRKYENRERRARYQFDGLFFGEDDEHVEGWRLEMDTEGVGEENCVERRIDDFGDAINGDQEEGTAEWRTLRNTIFLVVGGGVVTLLGQKRCVFGDNAGVGGGMDHGGQVGEG